MDLFPSGFVLSFGITGVVSNDCFVFYSVLRSLLLGFFSANVVCGVLILFSLGICGLLFAMIFTYLDLSPREGVAGVEVG